MAISSFGSIQIPYNKPDKHAVRKALEVHRPHRLLAPQGLGIPKVDLPFRPSVEHAANPRDLCSDKEFYGSLSDWKVMDIVREWRLKDIWLHEGDELDVAAKAVLKVNMCTRRNYSLSLPFCVESLPEIKANATSSPPFPFTASPFTLC